MAKTLRLHMLAKELGIASKEILSKCRAEGIELKNHMAAIPLGLAESIREWFSVGADVTSIEVAGPVDLEKVQKVRKRKTRAKEQDADQAEAPPTETSVATAVAEPPPEAAVTEIAEVSAPVEAPAPPDERIEVEPAIATPVDDASAEAPVVAEPAVSAPAAEDEPQEPPAEAVAPEEATPVVEAAPPKPLTPAGPQVVPKPAELQGPRVVRIERPEPLRAPRPRPRPPIAPAASSAGPERAPVEPGAATRGRGRGGGPGRGRTEEADRVRGRARSPRRQGRSAEVVMERVREWKDQDIIDRKERLAGATGHGLRDRRAAEKRRQASASATMIAPGRRSEVRITVPIMLKDFCAAVGSPFNVVCAKLLQHTGQPYTINQTIDAEAAELVALDLGVTLEITQALTAFEKLRVETKAFERGNLQPRPPVVAMLGHVDHGKTSLLDAIRRTNVAAGESGGITQHIGAYRIDHGDWQVTFLDTPGHEAFTAMRARGANLTDVVVLLVAADDGVMPQTVEAINHARAAGVQIVVALNKIDLPNVDLNRVYGQLAEHDLAPSEWGGHTDLIKTSATSGEGVEELIAHLSTLSELLELKADPTIPARGTVIEAQMREGKGVVAEVLVREGTLRPGQVFVCGPASGRVRSLLDDRGKRVKEALPGTPVAVLGLDELPRAGDALFVVSSAARGKEIAEEVREQRRQESLEAIRGPQTLEALLQGAEDQQTPELNVIIRADVQGSLDALRSELGKIPSDKVRLKILHTGVGVVSEADVRLAQASKAVVIGFHVVSDDRARRLADQVGVEIRQYRVIYEVTDDVQKALEGLLEPERREEPRAKAEVRQVFSVSRVGKIAGCLVVDGVVERSHRARLVRDGKIILEGAPIASLRRFKDDVREVRNGMECGIKLGGFDDLKPGDVIEAFEVVEVAQKL